MVRIFGQNMKLGAVTADIQSRAKDAAGNDSPTSSARAIRPGGNGVQYEAEITHRASWDKTYVQIRCGDNTWSGWVLVTK